MRIGIDLPNVTSHQSKTSVPTSYISVIP